DPRLGFHFRNSFGVPIQIQARTFEVINRDGEVVPILNNKLGNGFVLAYPGLDSVGEMAESSVMLDKTNSNLAEALEAPVAFNWGLEAISHPAGNPDERGFIVDTSSFEIGVGVDLPLHGQVGQIAFSQTYSLDLDEIPVSAGSLRLRLETDIPFDLSLQMYLENEEGEVLDSLLAGMTPFISTVEVDENGRSVSNSIQQIDIALTEERMANLLSAHAIRLENRISTAQAGMVPVKLYTDYRFQVQLGVSAKL
ncbi:MAG: hypothetical protein AAFV07_03290, partial [Bacteroidota bacterium]